MKASPLNADTRYARPDDSLEDGLKFVSEDLEGLVLEIATRARRAMNNAECNPLAGSVGSVRELILFLEHQPSITMPNTLP